MRYIHGNGDSYTGWGWIGNDRYYFKDSVPVTGWQYIDGLKYYFGEDGRMWSDGQVPTTTWVSPVPQAASAW